MKKLIFIVASMATSIICFPQSVMQLEGTYAGSEPSTFNETLNLSGENFETSGSITDAFDSKDTSLDKIDTSENLVHTKTLKGSEKEPFRYGWEFLKTADDGYALNMETNGGLVQICHNGLSIWVSINALPAHIAHGDDEGACGNFFDTLIIIGGKVDETASSDGYVLNMETNGGLVQICHNGLSIWVSINALPAHIAHGDNEGACGNFFDTLIIIGGKWDETVSSDGYALNTETNGHKVRICHNGIPIWISMNALQTHIDHGDTENCESTGPIKGAFPKYITDYAKWDEIASSDGYLLNTETNGHKTAICHNGQSIMVSITASKIHLLHGDSPGPCN